MRWLIGLPCWGLDYAKRLRNYALPALRAAINATPGSQFRFLIHTNVQKLRDEWIDNDCLVEFRDVPNCGGGVYGVFGECHRQALADAKIGEYVALLASDLVPSRECFSVAEKQFKAGKKLVMVAATRTLIDPEVGVPVGASSRELLAWAWRYKHPIIEQTVWGKGRSTVPATIYFENGQEVILRGFHLHPFAAVKTPNLTFAGSTSDKYLPEVYDDKDIYVVTGADEMALAEISPSERVFPTTAKLLGEDFVVKWGRRATERHHWLFSHRVVIQGEGKDTSDIQVCENIMRKIYDVGYKPYTEPVFAKPFGFR